MGVILLFLILLTIPCISAAVGCAVAMFDLESKFRTGLLVIAMNLTLVATLHFYFSVQDMIRTWFEYQYKPMACGVFLFIVIAVCIYLTRFYIISYN